MKHVLIISGHTDLAHSVANKQIIETLEEHLPEARVSQLDALYPDFAINVKAEQEKLLWADIVVLQFPLFWYSAPSILHRWMEETFVHGFSHGSTGDKLKGKLLLLSFTTGAPEAYYDKATSPSGFGIDDYLTPYKSMCALTQMQYDGYVFTGGVSYANRTTPELIAEQKAVAVNHAERLIARLADLGCKTV